VEKAHADVFNVLLQVLDDGRLTDGHGRTVDFRNTVIVMTSNLGSDRIQEMMNQPTLEADTYDRVKRGVMEAVIRHFSPEFVNRIDETVVFHPLQKEQIRRIAGIQIALLNERLAGSKLALRVSDNLLDHIAEVGFDPVYGARPLKRAIQNSLENPLAEHVLRGAYQAGDVIDVDVATDGNLTFSLSPKVAEQAVA
jgi:ATP-dependent Clp protease ATP-binding subunit ClpB